MAALPQPSAAQLLALNLVAFDLHATKLNNWRPIMEPNIKTIIINSGTNVIMPH